jgi:hypothetical protein
MEPFPTWLRGGWQGWHVREEASLSVVMGRQPVEGSGPPARPNVPGPADVAAVAASEEPPCPVTAVRSGPRLVSAAVLVGGLMCAIAACGGEASTSAGSAEGTKSKNTSAQNKTTWQEPLSYTCTLTSSEGERSLIGAFRVKVRDGEVAEAVGLDERVGGPVPDQPGASDLEQGGDDEHGDGTGHEHSRSLSAGKDVDRSRSGGRTEQFGEWAGPVGRGPHLPGAGPGRRGGGRRRRTGSTPARRRRERRLSGRVGGQGQPQPAEISARRAPSTHHAACQAHHRPGRAGPSYGPAGDGDCRPRGRREGDHLPDL